jgi:hypothetical protein
MPLATRQEGEEEGQAQKQEEQGESQSKEMTWPPHDRTQAMM